MIVNEGGDASKAQNNICQTEAKEPGTCRLGNRCNVSVGYWSSINLSFRKFIHQDKQISSVIQSMKDGLPQVWLKGKKFWFEF